MSERMGLWRRFLGLPNTDPRKAFGVTFLVALVCALVVSSASVLLKPVQDAHVERERQARLAAMVAALPAMRELMEEAGVDALETRLVVLETGAYETATDPAGFDPVAAAKDPATSIALPPEADPAGLKRIATVAPVHLLERDGRLALVVLPVSGVGYQSLIRAYLALEPDLVTIAALTIVEQGETPGLGARIEEPDWQALWTGRRIADEAGRILIRVVQTPAKEPYEVDGISGATRTGAGVGNMLAFWLGAHGFGPFLERLKREGS
ncbi:NADH:ubiquinone reductase (Na(+)-transporting) subunit C [Defluviimonas sp. WL0024]|uniref:Na(+)-translocating NADH-quinone reductase subunit C n=1 Tax=Albidovulum salinarum TaxID=2984153 RepID=A0ABT2X0T6_9RHOB|nr:NADH:ubiquinone reductase (Na(+)-transporting) subunit C [Defluviimonas sp. WL0024]MCU9847543.1 NADH:ubiquinone reductase (Na(+)-transporting) subunit C [Defluviimonas sp. WL0024]